MTQGLSYYFAGSHRKRLILLILAFLSLPYLVDVAFFGDLTPTHYAQENASNSQQKVDLLDGTAALPYLSEQLHGGILAVTLRDVSIARRSAVPIIFPLEHLFSAYHPFRPPPSV
jgi:hypothetical protein